MRLLLLFVSLAASVFLPACAAQATPGQSPLSVLVKPSQTRISWGHWFNLVLCVVNTSKTPRSYRIMGCSWGQQWRADNPRIVSEGVICSANPMLTIRLAPGEVYRFGPLPMLFSGVNLGPLTFKMGFTPIGSRQTYWSRSITLQVAK